MTKKRVVLTERDMQIFVDLYRCKVLSLTQIVELYGEREEKRGNTNWDYHTIKIRLRKLEQAGLLRGYRVKGFGKVYTLSEKTVNAIFGEEYTPIGEQKFEICLTVNQLYTTLPDKEKSTWKITSGDELPTALYKTEDGKLVWVESRKRVVKHWDNNIGEKVVWI